MLKMPRISVNATPRQVFAACGGLYQTQRAPDGTLLSPLVGYAGRDNQGRQYVGEIFANFAKVERWPQHVRDHAALPLARKIEDTLGFNVQCCPAPEGGKMLAVLTAASFGAPYAHPEKVVTKVKTSTSREESELRFNGRHEFSAETPVLIIEDVCNNFSTTRQYIEEIESRGGIVAGIACVLNRSPVHRDEFVHDERRWPVLALWNESFPEYEQDDPFVAADIAAGNILWKPKDEWQHLREKAGPEAFE